MKEAPPFFHPRFIRRQFSGAGSQTGIFIFCVALSMLALVSLRGFGRSVNQALVRDARSLHAADVIVHAHRDFSTPLLEAVRKIESRGEARALRTWEFNSMATPAERDDSLLVRVKAVEEGYPWYGTVTLTSGRPFGEVLRPGAVIVEENLLGRLGVNIGDSLLLGGVPLEIADAAVAEDARPVTIFSLGPRVFVSAADLDRLGLVGKGSRVEHRLLLKTGAGEPTAPLIAALRSAAVPDAERVETFLTARSGARRFFDNFLFFLSLLGIFTLVLAGIGIQSALGALLRERRDTVAVLKALGAPRRFVILQYLAVVAVLGSAGTLLGVTGSFVLQALLFPLFGGFIPAGIRPVFSLETVLEGIVLGALATGLFALLPLWRLGEVTPMAIFRREEEGRRRSLPYWLSLASISLLCALLVLHQVRDLKTGLFFLGGFLVLIALSTLGAEAVLRLLRLLPIRSLALRQAVRGLFRPGNATRPVVITLTAALSVILAIGLVERNLEEEFVLSYPEDAPNLFLLDIQPGQRSAVGGLLGPEAEFYPIVTAQVIAINGRPIDRDRERKKARDNFGRDFYLTYRTTLLPDERLSSGPSLFDPDVEGPQVSLLEEVIDMGDLELGDRITFRIQGVPLEAAVTSLRRRTESSPRPFFYFVFPPELLADAPQTIFAAVRTDPGRTVELQNRVAAAFPNVSIIDAGAAAVRVGGIIARLSRIVGFFTLLGIAAGLLITVSSVLATRRARIMEAVYYRVLGGRTSFVLRVFTLEGTLLGLASGALALLFSQGITWSIAAWQLDIPYRPYWLQSLVAVSAVTALTVLVGLAASRRVLRERPAHHLREREE
jgi:putative ABC transport system permease protein